MAEVIGVFWGDFVVAPAWPNTSIPCRHLGCWVGSALAVSAPHATQSVPMPPSRSPLNRFNTTCILAACWLQTTEHARSIPTVPSQARPPTWRMLPTMQHACRLTNARNFGQPRRVRRHNNSIPIDVLAVLALSPKCTKTRSHMPFWSLPADTSASLSTPDETCCPLPVHFFADKTHGPDKSHLRAASPRGLRRAITRAAFEAGSRVVAARREKKMAESQPNHVGGAIEKSGDPRGPASFSLLFMNMRWTAHSPSMLEYCIACGRWTKLRGHRSAFLQAMPTKLEIASSGVTQACRPRTPATRSTSGNVSWTTQARAKIKKPARRPRNTNPDITYVVFLFKQCRGQPVRRIASWPAHTKLMRN